MTDNEHARAIVGRLIALTTELPIQIDPLTLYITASTPEPLGVVAMTLKGVKYGLVPLSFSLADEVEKTATWLRDSITDQQPWNRNRDEKMSPLPQVFSWETFRATTWRVQQAAATSTRAPTYLERPWGVVVAKSKTEFVARFEIKVFTAGLGVIGSDQFDIDPSADESDQQLKDRLHVLIDKILERSAGAGAQGRDESEA